MTSPETKTVHLIDDDEGVREALTILLAEAGFTVRSHKSGSDFLAVATESLDGCIVSDIRMPGVDGLELQQRLREKKIDLPLVFVTGHGDVQMAVQAMRGGALDFIEKPFDDLILVEAVNRALKQAPLAATGDLMHEIRDNLDSLTPREREVLDCMVAGKPNKITAHELGMSVRTVEVHRARIMQKMNAGSLSELVRQVIAAR